MVDFPCDRDTSIIESVSGQIADGMRPGTMVSYETTLPIGGTRRLLPILERGGLKAGEGFDLVFSPERVKSRSVLQGLGRTPKVVGGLHARRRRSARRASTAATSARPSSTWARSKRPRWSSWPA